MRADSFEVGDLVGIDPGYNAGIWLRPDRGKNISPEGGHVKDTMLVILEIDTKEFTRDPACRVISGCGKVGWTFLSRLKKLE